MAAAADGALPASRGLVCGGSIWSRSLWGVLEDIAARLEDSPRFISPSTAMSCGSAVQAGLSSFPWRENGCQTGAGYGGLHMLPKSSGELMEGEREKIVVGGKMIAAEKSQARLWRGGGGR